MHAKGLLARDDSSWPSRYRPLKSQHKTQLALIDNLVQKAFEGTTSRMLVKALSAKRISREELAHIKELIQKLEGELR